MLAGHETTSTALAWTVYALSQHPSIQTALREELRTLPLPRAASGCEPLDQETLAALDKLPLLDAVVRETLRLYAPVTMTSRAPTEDTTIPLARPYVDTQGVIRDSIFLPRGVIVNIPVLLINRSKELWGPDAAEWK
jgi:cytochrome P450